ncbi:uncharacterized protein LOC135467459 [Liolophura sinensis]|uniref:uncharacterized protein LOC135467459 n=1 Tax=Liolophura sinensis TaxID=3198878 RepID=UPI0031586886
MSSVRHICKFIQQLAKGIYDVLISKTRYVVSYHVTHKELKRHKLITKSLYKHDGQTEGNGLLLLLLTVYTAGDIVLWSMTIFPSHDFVTDFKAIRSYGEENMDLVDDPAGGHVKVMRVFYANGTRNPGHHPRGGAQFYSYPIEQRTSVTLTYDVYFAKNFDFVKGGKLPGLMGGTTRTCSGGRDSEHCFTTRFMFRREGDGEVYFYAPQDQEPDFCERENVKCNFEKGHSMGRGTWRFKTGVWQTISQHVHLNTLGVRDGFMKVWVDGHEVYESRHLLFRKYSEVEITGMFFSTFFGGSDSTWETPHDTYTYYKNFFFTTQPHPHYP